MATTQAAGALHRRTLALCAFLAVAFGVPWAGWISDLLGPAHDIPFSAYSFGILPAACSLAGFVAAFAGGGLPGLREFVARAFNPRFSPWLWLVAVGAPLLAGLLTFTTHPQDLLRGGTPTTLHLLEAMSWLNLLTGPLAEEFGWRGFLLPHFRARLSPLAASLLVGATWMCWHIPLFFHSVFSHVHSIVSFAIFVMSWSVVMAWAAERAKFSVLPGILTHWTINSLSTIVWTFLPALSHDVMPGGLTGSLAAMVVAIGFAAFGRMWRSEIAGDRASADARSRRV